MISEFEIPPLNELLRVELQEKIDSLNKPKNSLGKLETLALRIGLIQNTLNPSLNNPCHLLFGADHGIEREKVSVSPREVTWQQMINFTRGGGGVNLFCRQHNFKLFIIDVGTDYDLSDYPIENEKIARGTRNFRYEAAMSVSESLIAFMTGVQWASRCYEKGSNILCVGEMGIGNTSASAVWMHLLGNIPLEKCVGAGAGLDHSGIEHKYHVLRDSVERFLSEGGKAEDTFEVVRQFGGFEMVAAVGAMIRAASLRMIVLVDGFIMSACMLAASRLDPGVLNYAVFGHVGDENGHAALLSCMDADPLLNLSLRLGEGTGALCAYPLLESAVRMLNEMNNFENAQITKYF